MSIENHPNFHAVKFTTEIMHVFFESLRGAAKNFTMSDGIQTKIVKFVEEIEEEVDYQVDHTAKRGEVVSECEQVE